MSHPRLPHTLRVLVATSSVVSLLGSLACADLTAPSSRSQRGASPPPDPEPTAAPQPVAQPTAPATAAATARPTPPDDERVAASHILVAYKGALRADAKVTRSKEEAKKFAEQVATKAKTGDFAELAKKHSDGPSGPKGGALGPPFNRRQMVKPFSDAAFDLEVNGVSGVVETPFGFHVIKRTQ